MHSKQEHFDVLCESRVRSKVEEFEKKVMDEVSRGIWKPQSSLGPAAVSSTTLSKREGGGGSRNGVSAGNMKRDATTSLVSSAAAPMDDEIDSRRSSATGFEMEAINKRSNMTAAPTLTGKDCMQNILKTLLLFLPRPQEGRGAGGGGEGGRAGGNREADGRLEAKDRSPHRHQQDNQTEHIVNGAGNQDGPVQSREGGSFSTSEGRRSGGGDVESKPGGTLRLPHIGGGRPNTHDGMPNTSASGRPTTGGGIGGIGSGDGRSPLSRPNSRGGKIRKGSAFGTFDTVTDDDDALSINLDNYDSKQRSNKGQRSNEERLRKYDLKSGLGEIWVPPPSGLSRKEMPKTVVIFPLHTLDQGTSTDDLNAESIPLPKLDGESMTSASIDVGSKQEDPITDLSAATLNVDALPTAATSRIPVADMALEAIQKELAASTNPLSTLYHHFFPYLSVLSRHHLMAAASGVTCNRSGDVDVDAATTSAVPSYSTKEMAALFEIVAEEVSKLEYTSFHAMEALELCEQDVNNLIILASARQELDNSFYVGLQGASRCVLVLHSLVC